MAEKIEALYDRYKLMLKIERKKRKEADCPKLVKFQSDLQKTMVVWPRSTLRELEQQRDRTGIKKKEKDALQAHIEYDDMQNCIKRCHRCYKQIQRSVQ